MSRGLLSWFAWAVIYWRRRGRKKKKRKNLKLQLSSCSCYTPQRQRRLSRRNSLDFTIPGRGDAACRSLLLRALDSRNYTDLSGRTRRLYSFFFFFFFFFSPTDSLFIRFSLPYSPLLPALQFISPGVDKKKKNERRRRDHE